MALPDYSIAGTVLAISLVIMILSGLALYVAFRVRETFREERGKGIRVVKLTFLIGLLFLSGGVFYFFAGGVRSLGASSNTTSTSVASTILTVSSTTVTVTTSPTATSTSTPTTSTSSSTSSTSPSTTATSSSTQTTSTSSATSSTSVTTTTSSTSSQSVSMTLSYPSKVMVGSTFDFSITVVNGGSGTANSVAIQAGDIFSTFKVISSNYPISGNVIVVGDVTPGSKVVDLQLMAPTQPQQFSGTITLTYQQMSGPLATSVSIRVAQGLP